MENKTTWLTTGIFTLVIIVFGFLYINNTNRVDALQAQLNQEIPEMEEETITATVQDALQAEQFFMDKMNDLQDGKNWSYYKNEGDFFVTLLTIPADIFLPDDATPEEVSDKYSPFNWQIEDTFVDRKQNHQTGSNDYEMLTYFTVTAGEEHLPMSQSYLLLTFNEDGDLQKGEVFFEKRQH